MRITLDYGKTGLEVEVPDRNLVGPLGLRPVRTAADPNRALADALARSDRFGCRCRNSPAGESRRAF